MSGSDNDPWSVDRVPSKTERVSGIIIAAILSALFGSAMVLMIRGIWHSSAKPEATVVGVFAVVATLFLLSLRWLWRFARGVPARPTPHAQCILGLVLVLTGASVLIASILMPARNPLIAAGFSLMAVAAGLHNFYRARQTLARNAKPKSDAV